MRIHCFSTGRVRTKRRDRGVRRYLPGGWRDDTLPVNVFAVEHPSGVCLFDAGQTARAGLPGHFPPWYPFFRLARFELGAEDEAVAQLARVGIAPSQLRWIVLSHLHTDHVGGLADVATGGAAVVVARAEWEPATGLTGRLRGYLPQYWPSQVKPLLVEPGHEPATGVDLAGDGSLVVLATPGHTAGHVSLLVRAGTRTFLLGGDAAHSARALSDENPALSRLCEDLGAAFLATHDRLAGELLGAGSEEDSTHGGRFLQLG